MRDALEDPGFEGFVDARVVAVDVADVEMEVGVSDVAWGADRSVSFESC